MRIDNDGEFLGLASVALSLTDFVNTVVNKTIGEDGSTFMIDPEGIVKLHEDKNVIEKLDYSEIPQYRDQLEHITSTESYSFSYSTEGNTIYVNSNFIPELGWYLITEAS